MNEINSKEYISQNTYVLPHDSLSLPDEILESILNYFDQINLLSAACVCRNWNAVAGSVEKKNFLFEVASIKMFLNVFKVVDHSEEMNNISQKTIEMKIFDKVLTKIDMDTRKEINLKSMRLMPGK